MANCSNLGLALHARAKRGVGCFMSSACGIRG